MKLYVAIILAAMSVLSSLAHARDQGTLWAPEDERIMEVILPDSSVASHGMVIYPVGQEWYLPLGQLAESLGLSIQVSPSQFHAQGFVIDEGRTFDLRAKACSVYFETRKEKFDCRDIAVQDDDIYVKSVLLQRWLPIDIGINTFRSQILVSPREKLPEQMRLQREQEAKVAKAWNDREQSNLPMLKVPRLLVDGPIFDQEMDVAQTNNSGLGTFSLNDSTQITGELFGLETIGMFAGDLWNRGIERWRLQLSLIEPQGGLLGPLNAKSAQFFDVDLPATPLVANIKSGKGFLISNFPLNTPTRFNSTDFQGLLQPGWEVVLYQNEILIDRQSNTPDGRYFFKNIGLFYGRNFFRLAFFGPQGQRRFEYHTYNVGTGLLPGGATDYRFGFAQLPDFSRQLIGQYYQSLSSKITLASGFSYNPANARQYAYFGALGVNDLFYYSAVCAADSLGGKACELAQTLGLGTATLGWKYTGLAQFSSDLFSPPTTQVQTSQIEGNLVYSAPM